MTDRKSTTRRRNYRDRTMAHVEGCRDSLHAVRSTAKTIGSVYDRGDERRELLNLNDHFARWYEGGQTWIGTRAAWDRWCGQ